MKHYLTLNIILINFLCFSQTETVSLSNTVGEVAYESKDHRSNVYEVVSDRKTINNNQFQGVIIAATDYYPYGLEIPTRSFSDSSYKYGFQGQEKDEEVKGKGNSINYKYRMHDTRVGRFFAVDPLANKYPYNSTYAFSENTVVNAIELEGLELFTVHGTWQGSQGNSDNFDFNTMRELMALNGNTLSNNHFCWKWKSKLFNRRNIERKNAAKLLTDYVVKYREYVISTGTITNDEPITIVGYSHGGNVAIQAAKMIEEETGIKVNIVTIATPAYNDGSTEDPTDNESIKSHLHLYSEGDGVDGIAQGNETYTNKKTVNTVIPERFIPHNGNLDTHSEIGDKTMNKGLGQFLKWWRELNSSKIAIPKDFPSEIKASPPTEIEQVRDETGGTGHVNPPTNIKQ